MKIMKNHEKIMIFMIFHDFHDFFMIFHDFQKVQKCSQSIWKVPTMFWHLECPETRAAHRSYAREATQQF